jgi:hypothetical protein
LSFTVRPARRDDVEDMAEVGMRAWREGFKGVVPYESLGFTNDGGTERRQMTGGALEVRYRISMRNEGGKGRSPARPV